MDRGFRRDTAPDGVGASPPSEAWLFAQALLGKPVPSPSRARTEARANREQLEWLAQISDRHAAQLRALQSAEREARRQHEQLEWLAQISDDHERKVRTLLREEAEAREAQQRYEQFTEAWTAQEAQWDPSKHPRLGGPPNAGWFATTGGSASSAKPPSAGQRASIGATGAKLQTIGYKRAADAANVTRRDTVQQASGSANTAPTGFASHSGPKRVAAHQVSTRSGVGHRWAPVTAVLDKEIRSLLSDEAVAYAMGAYSGPTDPPHGNRTYGGLTHPQYNDIVKDELKGFIKQRKIKKMTVAQMEEFISLINRGLDASGKPDRRIAAFNNAIRKALPKGTAAPRKMEDILAAGRKYLKSSRFRLLAAGAVVSGVLSEVVAQQVNVLDVASKSGHYKRAMQALQDGDLDRAQRLLVGDRDSLYMEILVRVGAHAALNFKTAMEMVFESARNRQYK
jgi:hypothetical protein